MSDILHQVRVLSPFRGVRSDLQRGGSRFVELRAGNLLTTDELERSGLLTVQQNGEDLLVFGSDLRERTEPVEWFSGAAL